MAGSVAASLEHGSLALNVLSRSRHLVFKMLFSLFHIITNAKGSQKFSYGASDSVSSGMSYQESFCLHPRAPTEVIPF